MSARDIKIFKYERQHNGTHILLLLENGILHEFTKYFIEFEKWISLI